MAKQFIVKATVQGYAKKGDKPVVLKRSPVPQDVPSGLVKELLARELIEEVGATAKGKAAADSTPHGGVDDAGDDNPDD